MKRSMWIKSCLALLLSFFAMGTGTVCAAEKLVLQLPWHHQFQFAGYYMAKELGYYQDAGFDVEIRDVTQGENTVEAVVSGQADFGVSGSGLLVERSLEKPVVAIAAIFQQDPTVFLTLKKSGIHQPADFIGKKIMLSPGQQSLALMALLHQENVFDKIERLDTSFDYHSLLNGQTDVFNAYSTNEPYLLESQGHQVTTIDPEDYGIHFYGDILFTTEAFLKNKPKTLEKFRIASIKGWEYALSHPDKTIAVIQTQYHCTKTVAQLQFESAAITKIVQADLVEIGTMDLGRWAAIAYHLKASGEISAKFIGLGSGFIYEPPHDIHWEKLWKWVVGVFCALVLLLIFISFLSRSNVRLRVARQQLLEEALERKQVEDALTLSHEVFKKLTGSAKDGIIQINHEGNVVFWNPAATEIFGYAAEEIIGSNLHQILVPESSREKHQKAFPGFLKTGKGRAVGSTLELEGIHKNGQSIPLELSLSSFDLNGNRQAMAVVRDISERKKTEQVRLDLEAQIRQKYKMDSVGVMAGGIAHNFNNNLSIILGNIELSRMKMAPNKQVEDYLNNAKIGVLRSRDLIQQIMTYSRQGLQEKAPTQLPLIVDETLLLMRSTIPTTINLQKNISSDSRNRTVSVDASQVQECLINLCNNAMHAMEEKGNLSISVETVELQQQDIPVQYECQPGLFAKISVQDDGSGMSAQNLDKIFDLFYTTKSVDEGTGVGLSTVQGIVKQHGGLIKVSSTLGEGTRFDLYFPIVEQPQIVETTTDNENQPEGTERILFIDDDEMLAKLGAEILTGKGYQVVVMNESTEALKMFAVNAEHFDLVITDQTMPKLSGKDLIPKLRDIRPDIPTILCTGFSSKIDEETAKELGADAFLMKPLDLSKLLQTVRRVLDGEKDQ